MAAESPSARPSSPVERFEYRYRDDACPPQGNGDCESSLLLEADGRITMNPWGEPGSSTLEATLSPDQQLELSGVLAAPALTAALDQPCAEAVDSEHMTLVLAGQRHAGNTGHCNEPAVQAVRSALVGLASQHFGGHSLITPPF